MVFQEHTMRAPQGLVHDNWSIVGDHSRKVCWKSPAEMVFGRIWLLEHKNCYISCTVEKHTAGQNKPAKVLRCFPDVSNLDVLQKFQLGIDRIERSRVKAEFQSVAVLRTRWSQHCTLHVALRQTVPGVNETALTVFLNALLLPRTIMTDMNNLDGCFPQQVSKYGAEDH